MLLGRSPVGFGWIWNFATGYGVEPDACWLWNVLTQSTVRLGRLFTPRLRLPCKLSLSCSSKRGLGVFEKPNQQVLQLRVKVGLRLLDEQHGQACVGGTRGSREESGHIEQVVGAEAVAIEFERGDVPGVGTEPADDRLELGRGEQQV